MRLGGWILGILVLMPALMGCGKFADKFSRINGDVTRVHFDNSRNDQVEGQTLSGGLMIYFIDQNDTNKGRAFGFNSESAVLGKSVLIPNGSYRVYAYGFAGANMLEGQVKCGRGDGGQLITLGGSAKTVTIDLSASACGFGTNNEFGTANASDDPSFNNFDTMKVVLCSGPANVCTTTTDGTWYVKAEILAGARSAPGNFTETALDTLSSGCNTSTGSNYLVTNFRVPVGGSVFSPPIRVRIFPDNTCSGTASGTYQFPDGIKKYIGAATGSSYYVEQPATSSYYHLYLNRYF
jgi:hypothetical protein